jgi:hypothetical protein
MSQQGKLFDLLQGFYLKPQRDSQNREMDTQGTPNKKETAEITENDQKIRDATTSDPMNIITENWTQNRKEGTLE